MELIPDDGFIEQVCERGHQSIAILNHPKFEILSEFAISAIVDDHYRESVTSFSASLERLFEFYIDIVCRSHAINPSEFAETWKQLGKFSERQAGAFSVAYLLETGGSPKLLNQKFVAFRNNVVHQGKIPTRKEAVEFGQAVADCVEPILSSLQAPKYKQALLDEMVARNRVGSMKARSLKARTTSGAISVPFSTGRTAGAISIEDILDERANRPDFEKGLKFANALGSVMNHFRKADQ